MGSLFRPRMPNLPPVQPAPEPPELTDEEKAKIRDEQKYESLERLGNQLSIDQKSCQKLIPKYL